MKASEMKKGQTIKLDDKLYIITDYQHVKLGKGGAVYQTKIKSLEDGSTNQVRLRSDENVEQAYLDKKTFEFLYSSGEEYVLMDIETFDQITLHKEAFNGGEVYLIPNMQLQVSMYEQRPVVVELPNAVDMEVTDTAPEIKGATAQSQAKPATLESGAVVQVPEFVKIGDVVRVDTRTGEYVTRVQK